MSAWHSNRTRVNEFSVPRAKCRNAFEVFFWRIAKKVSLSQSVSQKSKSEKTSAEAFYYHMWHSCHRAKKVQWNLNDLNHTLNVWATIQIRSTTKKKKKNRWLSEHIKCARLDNMNFLIENPSKRKNKVRFFFLSFSNRKLVIYGYDKETSNQIELNFDGCHLSLVTLIELQCVMRTCVHIKCNFHVTHLTVHTRRTMKLTS